MRRKCLEKWLLIYDYDKTEDLQQKQAFISRKKKSLGNIILGSVTAEYKLYYLVVICCFDWDEF